MNVTETVVVDGKELNYRYMNILMPNIILNCVGLIVGVLGNSLVLLIYTLYMKTYIQERYFIPALALFDLIASTVSTTHGILDYMFFADYPSEILCKLLTFGSFFAAAVSGHTLLVIGVYRYLKICRPTGKQMTLFWKRMALIITILFSLSYSWVILKTAGIDRREYTVSHGDNGDIKLTGLRCVIDSGDYPTFYRLFYIGVVLMIGFNIAVVAFFYIRIGCAIYETSNIWKRIKESLRQNKLKTLNGINEMDNVVDKGETSADKKNDAKRSNEIKEGKQDIVVEDSSIIELNDTEESTETEISIVDSSTQKSEDKQVDSQLSVENKHGTPSLSDKQAQPKVQTDHWRKIKINFNQLFAAVVILYIISYLPTGIFFVVYSFNDFSLHIDLNLHVCLSRFYIINHLVNPFVYGYFDAEFRKCVKSLLKCNISSAIK